MDGYVGYIQGIPIYSEYKPKENIEGEFNDKVFNYLTVMVRDEAITRYYFEFYGDEIAICRVKDSFKIIKLQFPDNISNYMKEEIKGNVFEESYVCNAGFWTTEYNFNSEDEDDLEDLLKKFNGKRVKITFEEIE